MDGPTLTSILEFYTHVGLWDRRRETATQASKKKTKTSIQCQTEPALWKQCYRNVTSSPAVQEIPKKPDLGTSMWKAQRLGWSRSLAWVLNRDIPEGMRF